jgi:hypothetical protein
MMWAAMSAELIMPWSGTSFSRPGGTTSGYYRYRVHAYSGSSSYTLGFSRP